MARLQNSIVKINSNPFVLFKYERRKIISGLSCISLYLHNLCWRRRCRGKAYLLAWALWAQHTITQISNRTNDITPPTVIAMIDPVSLKVQHTIHYNLYRTSRFAN